jgi:hypothetical protein
MGGREEILRPDLLFKSIVVQIGRDDLVAELFEPLSDVA